MQKNFVTFLSPGTFLSEQTMKPIDRWDVDEAVKMSYTITERYGASPYGFYFVTRGRGEDDLDSKEISRSNTYYLGGIVETIEEVEARNDPSESILRSNMRSNGWDKIIVNTNSYRVTQPFKEGDVILPYAKRGIRV